MEADAITRQLENWTQAKGPLHGRLRAAFENAIQRGLIPAGTRLPAERTLAEALALSRTTVLTAYNSLKADGWLESRTGSGTFVTRRRASEAQHQAHSANIDATSAVRLFQVDSASMVDFAVGTTTPLHELPAHLFLPDAGTHSAMLADRNYMPLGWPRLRAAVASMYTGQGLRTTSDQVLITTGAQQGISLITALYVQRGDAVLVENPTYFGALDIFRLAGARLSPVPVGPEHVERHILRDRLVAAGARLMYLAPTYQNPTGAVMPELTRQCVAGLADEFGIPVIEDHCVAEMSLEGTPPGPIARYSQEGTVLTVGSMSKLFWGGLRVGWIRGPVAAIAQLARVKTAVDLGSAQITHAIAAQLLTHLDQAKAIRREQFLRRRALLASLLRERLPEWTFSEPAGGLVLWVRLPAGDTRYFAQCAARHAVAVTPGSIFAADEAFTDHLRIPFVLDEASLAVGVDRLAAAWSEYRGLADARLTRSAPIV